MDEIKSALSAVTLANILPTVLMLLVGILVIKAILKLAKKSLAKSKLENAAASLILSLLKVVLYGLLGMMAASKLGIDVTGVVALASVASLALQDSLSNVIGGFLLLSNHPFHSGDFVEIGGQAGVVQTIDITYTKLSTTDNKIISIPNSAVIGSQIVNYSSAGTRRVDISISASYDSSIEAVKAALLEAAKVEGVTDTPAAPFAAVSGYGESAINYTLRAWTSAEKYWDVFFTINENIKAEFDKAGVKMTYPHLNVHMDK